MKPSGEVWPNAQVSCRLMAAVSSPLSDSAATVFADGPGVPGEFAGNSNDTEAHRPVVAAAKPRDPGLLAVYPTNCVRRDRPRSDPGRQLPVTKRPASALWSQKRNSCRQRRSGCFDCTLPTMPPLSVRYRCGSPRLYSDDVDRADVACALVAEGAETGMTRNGFLADIRLRKLRSKFAASRQGQHILRSGGRAPRPDLTVDASDWSRGRRCEASADGNSRVRCQSPSARPLAGASKPQ